MKKKAEWSAPETWVCFDSKSTPRGTGATMIDACADAKVFDGGYTWRDRISAGWRCVRMYSQRPTEVRRAK